jgi:hypothetical protein
MVAVEGERHMLRSMRDLEGYAIRAIDGTIGHVTDFYFDDERWVVRYLVVDTGSWLSSRKVLISPIAIGYPNCLERILPVSLTKEQVENSPEIDTEKPVSRQHEILHLGYYGYPYYWQGAGLWGEAPYPNMMMPGYAGFVATPHAVQSEAQKASAQAEASRHQDEDPHLRSCKALMSYHVQATDGGIGHVQSLLVEEETWAIRYLVVNTSNWWLGHKVLVAPRRIHGLRWYDPMVCIDLTRQAVKDAPPIASAEQLDRIREIGIYDDRGVADYRATLASRALPRGADSHHR